MFNCYKVIPVMLWDQCDYTVLYKINTVSEGNE